VARSRITRSLAVALLLVGLVARVAAQAPAGSAAKPTEAAPDALLQEVRALRDDIQRYAGATIRVQLLLARLQLQEQRINSMGAQVAEVRNQIAGNARQQAEMADKVKRYTSLLDNPAAGFPPEQQKDIQNSIPVWRVDLQRFQAEGQRLAAQEADLSSQISTEQARWMDFNTRLDELEKSLPATRREQ
jgi:uncharacterized coiled-coil protein SlyX